MATLNSSAISALLKEGKMMDEKGFRFNIFIDKKTTDPRLIISDEVVSVSATEQNMANVGTGCLLSALLLPFGFFAVPGIKTGNVEVRKCDCDDYTMRIVSLYNDDIFFCSLEPGQLLECSAKIHATKIESVAIRSKSFDTLNAEIKLSNGRLISFWMNRDDMELINRFRTEINALKAAANVG